MLKFNIDIMIFIIIFLYIEFIFFIVNNYENSKIFYKNYFNKRKNKISSLMGIISLNIFVIFIIGLLFLFNIPVGILSLILYLLNHFFFYRLIRKEDMKEYEMAHFTNGYSLVKKGERKLKHYYLNLFQTEKIVNIFTLIFILIMIIPFILLCVYSRFE